MGNVTMIGNRIVLVIMFVVLSLSFANAETLVEKTSEIMTNENEKMIKNFIENMFEERVADQRQQLAEKGVNIPEIIMSVEKVTEIKEMPGYFLYKVSPVGKIGKMIDDIYLVSNGKVIINSAIDISTSMNIVENYQMEYSKIELSDEFVKIAVNDKYEKNDDKKKIYIITDFECPYCRRAHENINKIKDVADINFIMFPLDMHKNARFLAKIFLIVNDYSTINNVEASNIIFEISEDIARGNIKVTDNKQAIIDKIAEKTGVSKEIIENNINKEQYEEILNKSISLVQQMGINGTPAFLVEADNNKFYKINGYNPKMLMSKLFGKAE